MGLPVINIRYVPLTNTGNIIIKRIVDVCGAVFGMALTSPLMLLAALLIKLTSPGPVIFRQLNGRYPGRRKRPGQCAMTPGSRLWGNSCGAPAWTSCPSCSISCGGT